MHFHDMENAICRHKLVHVSLTHSHGDDRLLWQKGSTGFQLFCGSGWCILLGVPAHGPNKGEFSRFQRTQRLHALLWTVPEKKLGLLEVVHIPAFREKAGFLSHL